jgi:CBS domain-containing protein
MHDIAEFLRTHDPFSGLDESDLERLAERVEVEFFEKGRTIFRQGESSPGKVRIVRRGAIELVDRGRVLDLLGEGELFGHPSMLSGLPTGFEARAHEDTLCYAMSAQDAKPLLARPSSLPYLARSLLKRRKPGSADEAEVASAELAQQRATTLIRRPPLITEAGKPVGEVARLMDREASSAVLIRRNGELGIVTDRDLRSRVVARGRPIDTPVEEVMSTPVYTVPADATGADLMLKMLDHNVRHITVVSPKGEVMGVVSGIDLVAAESRTPFVLRRAIADATTNEELGEAAGRLHATVIALHRARLGPEQVSQVISAVAGALVRRIIELAIEAQGPPPAKFAWLALGSHGRREPVPSSDVDSGMAWSDESEFGSRPGKVIGEREVADYMHSIAQAVGDCLRVTGWRLDPHGVTAAGVFSGSSISQWRSSIERWLERPSDERVLIASSILLDGRIVVGPESGLDPGAIIYEREHRPNLERWMLRLALASKPPTGFLRDIVVEHSGEHRGRFDIKHGGLLPVIDIARYAALKADIDVLGTRERLRAGAEGGVLTAEQATTLEEAHELFSELRLEHQVQRLERGEEPDDYLDPKGLNPLTRRYLRDAFRAVASVQKSLGGQLAWTS